MHFRNQGRDVFRRARITRGAFYLLVAEVGLSLVFLLSHADGRAWFRDWLMATEVSVWRDLRLWTVFTGMFVQPRLIGLMFHGFILWMFVPALERWWGTTRFLWFAVATSVAANLCGTLVGTFVAEPAIIAGLDAFIYASIVAYGVLFARQPVQFFGVVPMTGKQLAIGILAFMALYVGLQSRWATGAGYAAACMVAWALASGRLAPRRWWLELRQKRVRRHLKLVKDDAPDKRWLN
jgi:membrane associated rhomboid family serine protease